MAVVGRRPVGMVRIYALVFGIAYLAVAVLEDVFGSTGLKLGDSTLLQLALAHNIFHWVVGLALLGAYFAGTSPARAVARAVAVLFVLATLVGLFVEPFTGNLVGFSDALPLSYNVLHMATAATALFVGFAEEKTP